MMQEIVVDTNVAVVANGDTGQANLKCVRACSQFWNEFLKEISVYFLTHKIVFSENIEGD